MYLFQNDLSEVESHLDKALKISSSQKNRTKLLRFLVPIKILMGKLPNENLLKKYKLEEYVHVVKAVKTGNCPLFDNLLKKHVRVWIQQGVYFLLIRARKLVMRNLVKHVYSILGGKHEIPLPKLEKAFNFKSEEKYSEEEVQCMLAGLCKNGFVKGYVLIEDGCLFLRKKNPFPFTPLKWNQNEF